MWAARETERPAWLHRATKAITQLAPEHPGLRCAILFGSVTMPGRFGPRSDIDVAVLCDTVEQESAFWKALEAALHRDVDVRPLTGAIADTALRSGVRVYG